MMYRNNRPESLASDLEASRGMVTEGRIRGVGSIASALPPPSLLNDILKRIRDQTAVARTLADSLESTNDRLINLEAREQGLPEAARLSGATIPAINEAIAELAHELARGTDLSNKLAEL